MNRPDWVERGDGGVAGTPRLAVANPATREPGPVVICARLSFIRLDDVDRRSPLAPSDEGPLGRGYREVRVLHPEGNTICRADEYNHLSFRHGDHNRSMARTIAAGHRSTGHGGGLGPPAASSPRGPRLIMSAVRIAGGTRSCVGVLLGWFRRRGLGHRWGRRGQLRAVVAVQERPERRTDRGTMRSASRIFACLRRPLMTLRAAAAARSASSFGSCAGR